MGLLGRLHSEFKGDFKIHNGCIQCVVFASARYRRVALICCFCALVDHCIGFIRRSMDQRDDDVSDNESEAYLGDDHGNVGPQDQEVADLDGAEAGEVPELM